MFSSTVFYFISVVTAVFAIASVWKQNLEKWATVAAGIAALFAASIGIYNTYNESRAAIFEPIFDRTDIARRIEKHANTENYEGILRQSESWRASTYRSDFLSKVRDTFPPSVSNLFFDPKTPQSQNVLHNQFHGIDIVLGKMIDLACDKSTEECEKYRGNLISRYKNILSHQKKFDTEATFPKWLAWRFGFDF